MSKTYDIKVELKDPTVNAIKVGDKEVDSLHYVIDKETYKVCLKENGFDVNAAAELEKFNEAYTKKTIESVVNQSQNDFKGNNTIVTATSPFGISTRNKIDVRVDKSVTIPFPGKPGETITGPTVKVQVKTVYTKMSSGYIKGLKEDLIEQMAKG